MCIDEGKRDEDRKATESERERERDRRREIEWKRLATGLANYFERLPFNVT